jgi:hypothetical protein
MRIRYSSSSPSPERSLTGGQVGSHALTWPPGCAHPGPDLSYQPPSRPPPEWKGGGMMAWGEAGGDKLGTGECGTPLHHPAGGPPPPQAGEDQEVLAADTGASVGVLSRLRGRGTGGAGGGGSGRLRDLRPCRQERSPGSGDRYGDIERDEQRQRDHPAQLQPEPARATRWRGVPLAPQALPGCHLYCQLGDVKIVHVVPSASCGAGRWTKRGRRIRQIEESFAGRRKRERPIVYLRSRWRPFSPCSTCF